MKLFMAASLAPAHKEYAQISGTFNSCNMDMSVLPDMYTRGPQAQGMRVHISGRTRVHMLQPSCTILIVSG